MERLSIDEIIAHCERKVERIGKYNNGANTIESASIDLPIVKEYWEHKQVSEYLKELKSYQDAEEQGLLYRTPVAIGQTVYTNFAMRGWYLRNKDKPYKAKVVFIGLNISQEEGGGFFYIAYEKLGCMMQFRFSDIGKGVFLTKEEAEQKLAEIRGDNNV